MSAHTQGPWAVCDEAPNPAWHIGSTIHADGIRVADAFPLNAKYEANARLIAAAPHMLAALRKADKALDALAEYAFGPDHDIPTAATVELAKRAIRVALAKAEGRQ